MSSKMAQFSIMFGDTKYADSIVQGDGKTLYLHKAIVCTRSGVLAAEFDDEHRVSLLSCLSHCLDADR